MEEEKKISMTIRIPQKLLEEVSKSMSKRFGISRSRWILEAMDEKTKKEERGV